MHAGWTGRIIDGRYAVESVIGAGGMGLVLRARHTFTGTTVALKVLKPELELDVQFQQRFLVEARAPNVIGHPAIVTVIDANKAPDGLLYLVMELLVGRPLRIPAVRGELGAADIRRILLELLDVLGAAHAKGFVHRDLKPENLFLVEGTGQLKLLDFGIVKVLDAQLARVRTATGATLGTPAYMAPEQFDDPRRVDARADLWAVGIIAFELLAGTLPFRAETTQGMLLAVATQHPDSIRVHLPDAPPALEAFFARALSRDIAGRFSSAAEMAHAVAALPFGTAIIPRPPPPPRPRSAPAETPIAHDTPFAHAATPASNPNAPLAHAATPASGPGAPFAHAPPDASAPFPHAAIPASNPGAPFAGGTNPANGAATAIPVSSPSLRSPLVRAPALAPARSDRRAWIYGLGAASAVSLLAITIGVVATRRDPTPAPAVTAQLPPTPATTADASALPSPPLPSEPAAIVTPPLVRDAGSIHSWLGDASLGVFAPSGASDAGLKPTHMPRPSVDDAATVATATPADPYTGEATVDPPPTAAEIKAACTTGCKEAADNCGNAAPTCVSDCIKRPEFRECLEIPSSDCNALSVCGMRAVCGSSVLRGSDSCSAAVVCQYKKCTPGDISCGCDCATSMAPKYAYALTAYDSCMASCKYDLQCISTQCAGRAAACP